MTSRRQIEANRRNAQRSTGPSTPEGLAISSANATRHGVLSSRFGAAQDLLKRGFDTAAIMRAGGWKSVNVLARYLEQAEHNVWA
jgi:hypothetical protein